MNLILICRMQQLYLSDRQRGRLLTRIAAQKLKESPLQQVYVSDFLSLFTEGNQGGT